MMCFDVWANKWQSSITKFYISKPSVYEDQAYKIISQTSRLKKVMAFQRKQLFDKQKARNISKLKF